MSILLSVATAGALLSSPCLLASGVNETLPLAESLSASVIPIDELGGGEDPDPGAGGETPDPEPDPDPDPDPEPDPDPDPDPEPGPIPGGGSSGGSSSGSSGLGGVGTDSGSDWYVEDEYGEDDLWYGNDSWYDGETLAQTGVASLSASIVLASVVSVAGVGVWRLSKRRDDASGILGG